MNKTYRILPRSEEMLFHLILGLALSERERALLRACTLRHVEISVQPAEWEIVIGTQEVVEAALLARAAAQIAENYGLAQVFFQQNVIDLKGALFGSAAFGRLRQGIWRSFRHCASLPIQWTVM